MIIYLINHSNIDDGLRLTVDTLFNPERTNSENDLYKSEFPVDGYGAHENIWYKFYLKF